MTVRDSRLISVVFDHDPSANAAAITFDIQARGRDLQTRPVDDADGNTLAVVTFDPAGRLVQIELLDAARQLPRSLR